MKLIYRKQVEINNIIGKTSILQELVRRERVRELRVRGTGNGKIRNPCLPSGMVVIIKEGVGTGNIGTVSVKFTSPILPWMVGTFKERVELEVRVIGSGKFRTPSFPLGMSGTTKEGVALGIKGIGSGKFIFPDSPRDVRNHQDRVGTERKGKTVGSGDFTFPVFPHCI